MVNTVRVQMLRAAFHRVHSLRRMQVDRPAAESNPVFKRLLSDNIVLVQHVIAEKTAIFPLARKRAYPFQRHVVGIEFARIFDIIPYAINNRPQFVANALIVMDRVEFPAPFDPPIVAAGIAAADDPLHWNRRLRNVLGKAWRNIFDRCPTSFV